GNIFERQTTHRESVVGNAEKRSSLTGNLDFALESRLSTTAGSKDYTRLGSCRIAENCAVKRRFNEIIFKPLFFVCVCLRERIRNKAEPSNQLGVARLLIARLAHFQP